MQKVGPLTKLLLEDQEWFSTKVIATNALLIEDGCGHVFTEDKKD
jgi:hypothetical protein